MVLLIPVAVKKLKAEGRIEERQRIRAALDNLLAPANGDPVLIPLEEVMKIVDGKGCRHF